MQFLLITLVLFCLLLSPTTSTPTDIKSWCGKTPNPQPCEYFMAHNSKYHHRTIEHKSHFLKLSLELALERAMHATVNTHALGPKCRNKREKAAWADCFELYESTIQWLNKTIDPYTKCSQLDVQTWLSSALTDLDTCETGFHDLGVADYVFPLMSNNVSKLISNALALNKVPESRQHYREGFPSWVSPGDRKLLQGSSPASKANIVVAQDGSGNYKTIRQAIAAASGSGRFVIYVKAGTYMESVSISLKNIMLVGDGIGKTIITGSKSVDGGSTTYNSATVAITGSGFIAQGISVRNTAGAANHQAVAFRSNADLSVYYQCSFEGFQDTLYVYSNRQFYKNCDIHGTVDFIFGNAAVVFQNCNIYARNSPTNTNTLTAQGRTDPNEPTGISIQNCMVTADSDLKPVQSSVTTYLGRPWKEYSRTVFMTTFLDSLITPAGWMPWNGDFALNTLYYGEYNNNGPGSSTANRVKWGGYHVITDPNVASQFTIENFIGGNSWLPATKVPYTAGL